MCDADKITALASLAARVATPLVAPLIIVALSAVCLGNTAVDEDDPSLDPAVVAEALSRHGEIWTQRNRRFEGEITRADTESLSLRAVVGRGDAEITFQRDDIRSLRLGGGEYLPLALELIDMGNHKDGLRLLRAIHRQRGPLLPYLLPGDRLYFVEAVPRFRAAGDALTAVALARQLDPMMHDFPQARGALARERALGYLDLEFFEEAREEAKALVDAQPLFLTSATGHYTLARVDLWADNPEGALEQVLRAVVFGTDGAEELRECYALAIRLADQLGDTETANRLATEMKWRRFHALVDGELDF